MTLEDFKIGCEQWTRDEILESLYEITKQNNKAIEYITSEESIEIFRTIKSREEWLKINHNLLNILKGEE